MLIGFVLICRCLLLLAFFFFFFFWRGGGGGGVGLFVFSVRLGRNERKGQQRYVGKKSSNTLSIID